MIINVGDKFKERSYPDHQCVVKSVSTERVTYKIVNSNFFHSIGKEYNKRKEKFKEWYEPINNFNKHKSKLHI